MKAFHKSWAVHNLIGHPLMQILNTIGLSQLATKVHDNTLPVKKEKV